MNCGRVCAEGKTHTAEVVSWRCAGKSLQEVGGGSIKSRSDLGATKSPTRTWFGYGAAATANKAKLKIKIALTFDFLLHITKIQPD